METDDKVVEQKIIENIQRYGPSSGYLLSTGAGVNRGIPFRRMDMMIELTKTYGRYKIKKELYDPDEGLD